MHLKMNGKLLFPLVVGLLWNILSLSQSRKLEPDLGDYDESFGEYLREILENFRDQMGTGIPEIGVPPVDPLVIPNIDENINDGKANMVLRMRNLTISGLSAFELNSLAADLEKGVAYVNLKIPKLKASGFCYMNGKVLNIFPITSDGDFFIEVEQVEIEGLAMLNISSGEKVNLHMNDMKLSLTFGPLKIEFKSLLGGGKWTQTLLKLVSGLGGNLFKLFHEEAMKELDKVLLKVINKELDKGTLAEILDKIPLQSGFHKRRRNTRVGYFF